MSGSVFVTRRIPDVGLALLREAEATVTVGQTDEEAPVDREELLAGIRSCDVLLPLLTEAIDREALEANERLRGVAQMAVGYNNVDVEAASELGIPVSNTPGVLTETTADLTWALLLAAARRIPEAHNYQAARRFKLWGPNLLLGADVGRGATGRRKVLGIIGFGRIGQAVARRARGFDMEVLGFSRTPAAVEDSGLGSYATLEDLLRRSDFVSIHTPMTEGTHHLIGEAELALMKPTSYLVNTARGEIVDEAALVRALAGGEIAGAALDVYEDEPRMADGLADLDNVVLLPHVGSATRGTRGRMATMAAENAIAHLEGMKAPNVVNPEVYESATYRSRRGSS